MGRRPIGPAKDLVGQVDVHRPGRFPWRRVPRLAPQIFEEQVEDYRSGRCRKKPICTPMPEALPVYCRTADTRLLLLPGSGNRVRRSVRFVGVVLEHSVQLQSVHPPSSCSHSSNYIHISSTISNTSSLFSTSNCLSKAFGSQCLRASCPHPYLLG